MGYIPSPGFELRNCITSRNILCSKVFSSESLIRGLGIHPNAMVQKTLSDEAEQLVDQFNSDALEARFRVGLAAIDYPEEAARMLLELRSEITPSDFRSDDVREFAGDHDDVFIVGENLYDVARDELWDSSEKWSHCDMVWDDVRGVMSEHVATEISEWPEWMAIDVEILCLRPE